MSYKARRNFKSESRANKFNGFQDYIKEMIQDQEDELQFILQDFERDYEINYNVYDRPNNSYYNKLILSRIQKIEEEYITKYENSKIVFVSSDEDETIIRNEYKEVFWGYKYIPNNLYNHDITPDNWLACMEFTYDNGYIDVEMMVNNSFEWNYYLSKKERIAILRRAKEAYTFIRNNFFKEHTIKFSAYDGDNLEEKRYEYYKKISSKLGFKERTNYYKCFIDEPT